MTLSSTFPDSSKTVTISGHVGSQKFHRLVKEAKENKAIHRLRFWEVSFDDETVKVIQNLIHARSHWNTVQFHCCSQQVSKTLTAFVRVGVVSTIQIVSSTTPSRFRFVDDNNVNPSSSRATLLSVLKTLGAVLASPPVPSQDSIEGLDLRLDDLTMEGAEFLADGIAVSTSLKRIFFTYSTIQDDAILPLMDGLKQNKHIQEISFEHCNLSDNYLAGLISSLKDHSALRKIGLDFNNKQQCRNQTIVAVTSLLVSPFCSLTDLNLAKEELVVPGTNVNGVEVLDHNGQVVDDATGKDELDILRDFIESLKINTSLRSLNLSKRSLDDNLMKQLASILERDNTTLHFLNLTSCMITDNGLCALAKALPRMRGLKKLWLGGLQAFSLSSVRTLIVDGLRDNTEILDLILPPKDQSYFYRKFAYYCTLNSAGRRLLRLSNPLSLALWPFVLERANQLIRFTSQDKAHVYTSKEDVIFYFLRNKPEIVEASLY